MMEQQLRPRSPLDIPLSQDGDIYRFEFGHDQGDAATDLKGIPPLDYSLYLVNTVKFHLCHLFGLFDETDFITHLHEFYHDASEKIAQSKFWYIQFLLVLAFGKAFLSRPQSNKTERPPGATLFTRAMALLPGHSHFWTDPLLAIEVLAMAALYLYSVDKKESAYLYVSVQALRNHRRECS